MVQKVSEGDIDSTVQPMAIFSHIDKLGITELADTETDPTKNIQDNGVTPPFGTQTSSLNLPLEDTLVAPSKPPPRPRVEAGDAALQERAGDLPDILLLGANDMLFRVYQDWMHQNPGEHLDVGIAEDGKFQTRW